MSTKKTRTIIYLLGILIILFFVYLNAFRKKEKVYVFGVENEPKNHFSLLDTQDYNQSKLEMNFKKEVSNPENIKISVNRTLFSFAQDKKQTITKTEELKELLFKGNQTAYPNGSLLEYGKELYFLEKGELRKIQTSHALKEIGIDFGSAVTIDKETFDRLEKGDPITSTLEFKRNPPTGLLVKSGSSFFIISSNDSHPILSEKLIESVWENFFFLEIEGQKSNQENVQCFLLEDGRVSCEVPIGGYGNNGFSNAYEFEISGIPQDLISQLEVTLTKKPDKNSTAHDLGKLFFGKINAKN